MKTFFFRICDQFYIHLCRWKLHLVCIVAITSTIQLYTTGDGFGMPTDYQYSHRAIYRKLLQASIRANKTGHFIFVASDSWGAKSHPVRDQEFAAVNTITVLPQRTNLDGKLFI